MLSHFTNYWPHVENEALKEKELSIMGAAHILASVTFPATDCFPNPFGTHFNHKNPKHYNLC